MVYGRKTYGKKRAYRPRRKTYRRYAPRKTMYRIAKNVLYKNVEHKLVQIDANNQAGTAVTLPTFVLLNGLARGTNSTDRIGRTITMTSIQANLLLENMSTATSGYFRWIIFYDRQPSGTTPVIGALYDTTTCTFVDGAMRNLDYRKRFVVIKEGYGRLSEADSDEMTQKKIIRLYCKLYRKTVYNAGVTGTITDLISGALYFMWSANLTTNAELTYSFRLRYTDA